MSISLANLTNDCKKADPQTRTNGRFSRLLQQNLTAHSPNIQHPIPKNLCPTISPLCSNAGMTHDSPNPAEPAPTEPDFTEPDTILDFTPVPLERVRANGWSPLMQRRFIEALSVMGSVGQAARAVGMGRVSAYRLRDRALAMGGDGAGFVRAWNNAIGLGRSMQFGAAMDRAINGVTTVRVLRGGSVSVTGGPDMSIIRSVLREAPVQPGAAR
jgi:hypothetical protein